MAAEPPFSPHTSLVFANCSEVELVETHCFAECSEVELVETLV
jgi:hypothetical protein